MKSFLRYVETGKARSNVEQPVQDDSSDASYQRALSNVGSVVSLPPDFVSPSMIHASFCHCSGGGKTLSVYSASVS